MTKTEPPIHRHCAFHAIKHLNGRVTPTGCPADCPGRDLVKAFTISDNAYNRKLALEQELSGEICKHCGFAVEGHHPICQAKPLGDLPMVERVAMAILDKIVKMDFPLNMGKDITVLASAAIEAMKPVLVSLERCVKALLNIGYYSGDAPKLAKAVLDAAGVAYVD